MKRYAYKIVTVVLLMYGLIHALSSCDREDIPGGREKPELPTENEKVVINFTISASDFNDDVETRGKTSPNPSERGESSPFGGLRGGADLFEETAIIPITDNILMYATLKEEETPVSLRSTSLLEPGTTVRIVAYVLFTGDTINMGYADYTVSSNGTTLIPDLTALSVYSGLEYMFVAYSLNTKTTLPSPMELMLFPSYVSEDIMWGETTETISSSGPTHIIMYRKQSKVFIDSQTEVGKTNTLNSVGAVIECIVNPVLNVKTGQLSPSAGLTWKPFAWTITNPLQTTQKSDTLYVLTDEVSNTHIRINQMSINNILYNDTIHIVYSKPLEGGKYYTLQVSFKWSRGGASDRITWEPPSDRYAAGRYVITRDPRDAGLYFQFGSVVGIYSANGYIQSLVPPIITPSDIYFQSPRDIAWSPVSIPDWAGIPYASVNLVDSVFHTALNVKAGRGDPCRLVGLNLADIAATPVGSLTIDDIDNGVWRLPTTQENRDFSGYQTDINQLAPADWWWAQNGPGNISSNVSGGEFHERGKGGTSKFLPAAGFRHYNGGYTSYQGSDGYYWTNQDRLMMVFNNANFYPATLANFRYSGMGIRCVKQKLSIDVNGTEWEDGGELNPNANTIL